MARLGRAQSYRPLLNTRLTAPTIFTQALTVAALAVPVLTKVLIRVRSIAATATSVPQLSKRATFLRTLSVSATAVMTFARTISLAVRITAAGVATLTRAAVYLRTLSVSATARVKMLVNGLLAAFSRKYPSTPGTYTTKYEKKGTSYDQKYP